MRFSSKFAARTVRRLPDGPYYLPMGLPGLWLAPSVDV